MFCSAWLSFAIPALKATSGWLERVTARAVELEKRQKAIDIAVRNPNTDKTLN